MKKRIDFIDRTARKPRGLRAIKNYNDPKGHYRSFKIILNRLSLHENDVYCEVGCGGGVLLRMALASVKKGAAIDHSPDMVALSVKNNQEYVDSGRVEIVDGNAEQLPWKASTFTACASANMFFFIENPLAMLGEVFRILKPGGRFAMVTMGRGILGLITFGWLYKLRTYSNKQMKLMLEKSGFKNVIVRTGTMGFLQECYGEKQ